jgi:hypothetical protein
MEKQVWSGHGLDKSTEDPRTWESSRLRRLLKRKGLRNVFIRKIAYGILVNRRTHG